MPRTLILLDPFLDLVTTSLTTIRTTLDGHRTATRTGPPDPDWADLLTRALADTDTALRTVTQLQASLDALQEAGDTVTPWVRSSLRRPTTPTGDTP